MKNIVFICLFFFCGVLHTQTEKSFKSGEILKYKISYSGWFKAGKATVSIDEKKSMFIILKLVEKQSVH